MLFDAATWPKLENGSVTVAYRSWKRPTVKAGGTLRSPVGMLSIDALDVVERSALTDADALAAGEPDLESLLGRLVTAEDRTLYRIRFHLLGADPRIALRQNATLSDADVDDTLARLARSDARATDGPWSRRVLELLADHPAVRSADLCGRVAMTQPDFKKRVRRLKELGLTESLGRGYCLSPRGEEFLRRIGT